MLRRVLPAGLVLAFVVVPARGQMRANEPGGELPPAPGVNATVVAVTQHDTANGWTSVLTPTVEWRLSPAWSADLTLPLFLSITTETNVGTRRRPQYDLQTERALGDLQLNGSYERRWEAWSASSTLTLGLPTGKTTYGLGAGKVTYGTNNRLGYSFDRVVPDVEVGFGNSSNTVGTGPVLPYVANANFLYVQTGATAELPLEMSLRAEVFEMLPLSAATIYSNARHGRLAVADGEEEDLSGEDNGLNALLTLPVASHWTAGAFVTHSVINHYDIGGFSVTYSMRPRPRATRF